MANVQPEHGTAPLAYALLSALSRDGKMRTHAQIIFWVLRNTYGRRAQGKNSPRRKTCSFTWTKIAEQIGQTKNRSRVSLAGRDLIESGRLYLDARGCIGIQKDWEKWAKGPGSNWHSDCATPTRVKPAQQPGQTGTAAGSNRHAYVGCAREVLTVKSYPFSLDGQKNSSAKDLNDTPTARAERGDPALPPHDLPEFSRLSFKVQNRLIEQWEAKVKPAAAVAAAPCAKCGLSNAAMPGARICASCSWCIDCDEAGRESRKAPAELTTHPVHDGGLICRPCLAQRRTEVVNAR